MEQRRAGRSSPGGRAAKIGKNLEKAGSSADPPKLDLEIAIRDFGPIRDGRIRLRPLTIFVGPNGSGKSYAARLAHSAISLLGGKQPGVPGASGPSARAGAGLGGRGKARPQLKAGGRKNEFLVTKRALCTLSRHAGDAIAAAFSGQIEKDFGAHPSSLVRSGRARASIEIPGIVGVSIPRDKEGRPALLGHAADAATAREALAGGAACGVSTKAGGDGALACAFPAGTRAAVDAESAYDMLLERVLAAALGGRGHAVPAAAYHVPSARSGIMEACNAAAAASAAHSHAHERDGPQAAPHMETAGRELLSTILEMGGTRGQFSRIADELERDALHGRITLRRSANGLAPGIRYAGQREMPIRLAASAASELAPIVLLLRRVAKRGDLLVVEEPESHQHPKNQVVLAKCIVRLVRSGLNVIVTTHSTYIVERFSAYLRAGLMTAGQRSRVGIGRGLYLEAVDIAPYLFEARGNKTTIKAIDHSPQEGISQDEFMSVNEALHEENIRVDRLVG